LVINYNGLADAAAPEERRPGEILLEPENSIGHHPAATP
jgi:hypothetical protein